MAEYIADYEIPVLMGRFEDGDLEAGRRLVRFYESEMASMAIRRLRLVEALAAAEQEPIRVEAEFGPEVIDVYAIEG